jgi:Zn-dependent peptidase ImmA (M78 family)
MLWIREKVKEIIETYGTRDIYELLKHFDVEIIYKKEFANPKAKAILHKDEHGFYYIYLLDSLDECEKIFILYHELGHIVLHDLPCDYYFGPLVNRNKFERQADCFATLMALYKRLSDSCYLENLSIDQLRSYFELPKDLLQYKLEEVIAWQGELM